MATIHFLKLFTLLTQMGKNNAVYFHRKCNIVSSKPNVSRSFVIKTHKLVGVSDERSPFLFHTRNFLISNPKQESSGKFGPKVQPTYMDNVTGDAFAHKAIWRTTHAFLLGMLPCIVWGSTELCSIPSHSQPSPENSLLETPRSVNQIRLMSKAEVQFLKYFILHAKICPRDDKELPSSFSLSNVPLQLSN